MSVQTSVSHFRLLTDPAGVTEKALKHTYPGAGTMASPHIVDLLQGDPYNPLLLPRWKKIVCTILVAFATLAVTFISSAYSGAVASIIDEFAVSENVVVLGISVFVLGFALGPLLWAPLSEHFGRRLLFLTTYFALTAFNGGCVGANSFATLTVLRFFAGVFGSSSLTNSGAIIADIFDANERGMMLAIFLAAPLLGPSFGPIVGGYLGEAAGWRWVHGLFVIFTGILWILITLLIPETYGPFLLSKRATKLSETTGKVYLARTDMGNKKNLSEQYRAMLIRPWLLLFCEPIVFLTSIYMAIVYGTLYMMFPLLPPIFQSQHGWSAQTSNLSFLGVAVGMSLGVLHGIWNNKHYVRIAAKHNGFPPPEVRLKSGILASVTLPVGLFWFTFTNGSTIHWIVPIIGTAIFSYGLVVLFLSLTNYLVDTYVVFAASVLAASTVLRSVFGAAFPLFTTPMLQNLGIHWASSVPAFLALACMTFLLLFYIYGRHIRSKGRYAAQAADILQKLRSPTSPGKSHCSSCQRSSSLSSSSSEKCHLGDTSRLIRWIDGCVLFETSVKRIRAIYLLLRESCLNTLRGA